MMSASVAERLLLLVLSVGDDFTAPTRMFPLTDIRTDPPQSHDPPGIITGRRVVAGNHSSQGSVGKHAINNRALLHLAQENPIFVLHPRFFRLVMTSFRHLWLN